MSACVDTYRAVKLFPGCADCLVSTVLTVLTGCFLQALDRWEERLEALFEGRPYDELDATLTDSLSQYPVDIQPFRWVPRGARAVLTAVPGQQKCAVVQQAYCMLSEAEHISCMVRAGQGSRRAETGPANRQLVC
jgi:hypothetical protein